MIKELKIRNFKCCLESQVPMNKLTILAGANAVGKSSVIQSLLLVRQTIDKAKSGSNYDKVLLNGEYCLRLGNSTEVLSSTAEKEEIVFEIYSDIDQNVFKYCASREKDLFLQYDHDSNVNFDSGISLFHHHFHYLYTERLGPRAIQDMRESTFPNVGFQGEYTAYVISELSEDKVDELRRYNDENKTVPNLNKQIEYWMDFIIPGIELQSIPYKDMNIVGLSLKRKFSETNFLNPNNLGFGISYILPIIVSGLVAEKGCLFIVENPEVHLHPRGQSRMGQFLAKVASSGVQVVIETHSEHIINGIRLAILNKVIDYRDIAINYLDIEKKGVNMTVDPIPLTEHAEITRWPKGFLDQEQRDLREIIELRRGVTLK